MLLLFLVVAVPRELSGPSLAGLPFDVAAAGFFAVMGWLCFRMGFRLRLTAQQDHVEVVNLLTVERIAYRDVAAVHQDWLSVHLMLVSGRRLRVWSLPDSLLTTGRSTGGPVPRLTAILAERRTDDGPRPTRSRFPDRWVALILFALFSGAVVYRLLAR